MTLTRVKTWIALGLICAIQVESNPGFGDKIKDKSTSSDRTKKLNVFPFLLPPSFNERNSKEEATEATIFKDKKVFKLTPPKMEENESRKNISNKLSILGTTEIAPAKMETQKKPKTKKRLSFKDVLAQRDNPKREDHKLEGDESVRVNVYNSGNAKEFSNSESIRKRKRPSYKGIDPTNEHYKEKSFNDKTISSSYVSFNYGHNIKPQNKDIRPNQHKVHSKTSIENENAKLLMNHKRENQEKQYQPSQLNREPPAAFSAIDKTKNTHGNFRRLKSSHEQNLHPLKKETGDVESEFTRALLDHSAGNNDLKTQSNSKLFTDILDSTKTIIRKAELEQNKLGEKSLPKLDGDILNTEKTINNKEERPKSIKRPGTTIVKGIPSLVITSEPMYFDDPQPVVWKSRFPNENIKALKPAKKMNLQMTHQTPNQFEPSKESKDLTTYIVINHPNQFKTTRYSEDSQHFKTSMSPKELQQEYQILNGSNHTRHRFQISDNPNQSHSKSQIFKSPEKSFSKFIASKGSNESGNVVNLPAKKDSRPATAISTNEFRMMIPAPPTAGPFSLHVKVDDFINSKDSRPTLSQIKKKHVPSDQTKKNENSSPFVDIYRGDIYSPEKPSAWPFRRDKYESSEDIKSNHKKDLNKAPQIGTGYSESSISHVIFDEPSPKFIKDDYSKKEEKSSEEELSLGSDQNLNKNTRQRFHQEFPHKPPHLVQPTIFAVDALARPIISPMDAIKRKKTILNSSQRTLFDKSDGIPNESQIREHSINMFEEKNQKSSVTMLEPQMNKVSPISERNSQTQNKHPPVKVPPYILKAIEIGSKIHSPIFDHGFGAPSRHVQKDNDDSKDSTFNGLNGFKSNPSESIVMPENRIHQANDEFKKEAPNFKENSFYEKPLVVGSTRSMYESNPININDYYKGKREMGEYKVNPPVMNTLHRQRQRSLRKNFAEKRQQNPFLNLFGRNKKQQKNKRRFVSHTPLPPNLLLPHYSHSPLSPTFMRDKEEFQFISSTMHPKSSTIRMNKKRNFFNKNFDSLPLDRPTHNAHPFFSRNFPRTDHDGSFSENTELIFPPTHIFSMPPPGSRPRGSRRPSPPSNHDNRFIHHPSHQSDLPHQNIGQENNNIFIEDGILIGHTRHSGNVGDLFKDNSFEGQSFNGLKNSRPYQKDKAFAEGREKHLNSHFAVIDAKSNRPYSNSHNKEVDDDAQKNHENYSKRKPDSGHIKNIPPTFDYPLSHGTISPNNIRDNLYNNNVENNFKNAHNANHGISNFALFNHPLTDNAPSQKLDASRTQSNAQNLHSSQSSNINPSSDNESYVYSNESHIFENIPLPIGINEDNERQQQQDITGDNRNIGDGEKSNFYQSSRGENTFNPDKDKSQFSDIVNLFEDKQNGQTLAIYTGEAKENEKMHTSESIQIETKVVKSSILPDDTSQPLPKEILYRIGRYKMPESHALMLKNMKYGVNGEPLDVWIPIVKSRT